MIPPIAVGPPTCVLIATRPATSMRSRRKLIGAGVALLAMLGGALFWLLRSAPPPMQLHLVRIKEETNGPVAIIQFTNCSASRFRWDLRTYVSSNGVWRRAPRQPVVEYAAATLGEHQASNQAVPVPDGQNKWRVELWCRRADSKLEDAVEDAFRFVKLKSPFPDSRRREIITVLDFE